MPPRKPLTPRDRQRLTERASPEQAGIGPIGFAFTPERHNLTASQCLEANRLLRRLERQRPIQASGPRGNALRALRIGGVISAIRRGAVGSYAFGRALHGHLGGKVMALHGLHILREQAPRGYQAMRASRERRRAQEVWETTGDVMAIGQEPAPRDVQAQHIQDLITAWEAQQWQRAQEEQLRW